MDFRADHFSLFGLNQAFRLDLSDLDSRYRDIQAQVHPDRFVNAGDAERRMSMQWATHANEAYLTLKKPLERAKYMLHLAGHDIQAENNTAMPTEHLHNRLRADINARFDELAELFDLNDHVTATDRVRRLMFLEKLLHEIDDALASLEE